jgi:hypothetical protein
MKTKKSFLVVFLWIVLFAACGKEEIVSPTRTGDIVIDGSNEDWQGALAYYDKQKVALGTVHDNDYLYLCLLTTDRSLQMQIMHSGLTIWLAPQQGKKEKLGIHYPISNAKMGRPEMNRNAGRQQNADMEKDPPASPLMMWSSDLEVLSADKKTMRREPAGNFKDIKAALRDQEGTLIYELAVPLQTSERYRFAIGAKPGEPINLTMEIATQTRPAGERSSGRGAEMGGGRPGGPDGGMDEGPEGGMGGGRPGGMGGGRRGGAGGPGGGMGSGPMDSSPKVELGLVVRMTE